VVFGSRTAVIGMFFLPPPPPLARSCRAIHHPPVSIPFSLFQRESPFCYGPGLSIYRLTHLTSRINPPNITPPKPTNPLSPPQIPPRNPPPNLTPTPQAVPLPTHTTHNNNHAPPPPPPPPRQPHPFRSSNPRPPRPRPPPKTPPHPHHHHHRRRRRQIRALGNPRAQTARGGGAGELGDAGLVRGEQGRGLCFLSSFSSSSSSSSSFPKIPSLAMSNKAREM